MLIHGLQGTYAPFDTATILFQGYKDTGKACVDIETGEVAVAFRGTPVRYGTPYQTKIEMGEEIYLVCTLKLGPVGNLNFLSYDPLAPVKEEPEVYGKTQNLTVSEISPVELALRVAQAFSRSISPNHPYAKKETRTISLQISELAPMSDGDILVVGETKNLSNFFSNLNLNKKRLNEVEWMTIYTPLIAMTRAVPLMDVVATRAGVTPDVAYRVMREIRDTMAAAMYDGLALGLSKVSIKVPGFMESIGEVTRNVLRCQFKVDPAFRRQVMLPVKRREKEDS